MNGSGLLGVELVLQLHEFARSFDLVGNLLPLREETLALLEGQTLRSAAGDRVLLLLTAKHTHTHTHFDQTKVKDGYIKIGSNGGGN